ncbi:MAG: tetratricopeptide repeat protein [Paludibacter sp.]|nr:tetratricopeptide repeat protein [Paludibacter sp.]MDD4197809.1 tetratricopeptide repeat protein [Paludibacter sp.]MDD4427851.1 tetratricopeptide repeat protein [Paludibacter sp.]
MKITVLFLLFQCLLTIQLSVASNTQTEVQDWIDKSKNVIYINPEQAAYYASKAIELLPGEEQNDQKAEALFAYSQAEKLLGNFDSGVKTLYDALEYVTPSNNSLKGQIYSLMGIVYCRLTDYNKAIELNEKATSIFKALGDSASIATCYNNRGIIHYDLNEFNIAEQFFRQSLAINRSLKQLKAIAANLNNMCLYEGNFEEKIELINEAIIINKNLNSQWSLGENYNNMGKQYFYAKKYMKALEALQKANEVASALGAKELICDNYEYFSWVYAALGDYENAYQCITKLNLLSKEVQSSNKLRNVELEISQKRYQDQKRAAESKEQNYKIELLRRNIYILLVVLVLLIITSVFLTKWYKRKKYMELMKAQYNLEQSEREIAELKVRQQDLELKSVQNELDNKRKEITSFAIFLLSRNELLEKIREMIKQGYKMNGQELISHLKRINVFIAQYQSGDKNNTSLLMNVEEKNQEFQQHLSELHPNLTQGEKSLATLLRINLSTKEISILTGNIPKTINMSRYRLRKSLNLCPKESLTNYLQNI